MLLNQGFPSGSAVKNPPAVQELQEMQGWSLGQEDPLEEGHENRLQYSCLENPMDREDWWVAVHTVKTVHGHDLSDLACTARRPLNQYAKKGVTVFN